MDGEVEARLEQFEALLRERGLPLTVQRREILKIVLERDDHPTADQVYDAAKGRISRLSRTTVYRVLDALVALGVIRRLHHPGATARFDGRAERHHHLFCSVCGRVVDVCDAGLDSLELLPGDAHGFSIDDYAVHFVGTCPECRRKAPS